MSALSIPTISLYSHLEFSRPNISERIIIRKDGESILHTNDRLPPDNSIRMLELIMLSTQSALSARAPAAHGSGSSDLALGDVKVLVAGARRGCRRVLGI